MWRENQNPNFQNYRYTVIYTFSKVNIGSKSYPELSDLYVHVLQANLHYGQMSYVMCLIVTTFQFGILNFSYAHDMQIYILRTCVVTPNRNISMFSKYACVYRHVAFRNMHIFTLEHFSKHISEQRFGSMLNFQSCLIQLSIKHQILCQQ